MGLDWYRCRFIGDAASNEAAASAHTLAMRAVVLDDALGLPDSEPRPAYWDHHLAYQPDLDAAAHRLHAVTRDVGTPPLAFRVRSVAAHPALTLNLRIRAVATMTPASLRATVDALAARVRGLEAGQDVWVFEHHTAGEWAAALSAGINELQWCARESFTRSNAWTRHPDLPALRDAILRLDPPHRWHHAVASLHDPVERQTLTPELRDLRRSVDALRWRWRRLTRQTVRLALDAPAEDDARTLLEPTLGWLREALAWLGDAAGDGVRLDG